MGGGPHKLAAEARYRRPAMTGLGAFVDSRALYYRDGLGGRAGNWVDGTPRTGPGQTDGRNHHLAKVRVAGSNPVFRSEQAGQAGQDVCFNHLSVGTMRVVRAANVGRPVPPGQQSLGWRGRGDATDIRGLREARLAEGKNSW